MRCIITNATCWRIAYYQWNVSFFPLNGTGCFFLSRWQSQESSVSNKYLYNWINLIQWKSHVNHVSFIWDVFFKWWDFTFARNNESSSSLRVTHANNVIPHFVNIHPLCFPARSMLSFTRIFFSFIETKRYLYFLPTYMTQA